MSGTPTMTSSIPMGTDSAAGSAGSNTMMMKMATMMIFSNDNMPVSIFSSAFTPQTEAQYVGAWLFAFILAVIWRGLVFAQLKLDQHFIRKYAGCNIIVKQGDVGLSPTRALQSWRLSTNLPRAALGFVTQGIAYLLMIIVMILNVGLFFAVIVGFFVGELMFGRIGSHSGYDSSGCT
ncbi:hypothetical protein PV08_08979 [Exophiala spinifera]|uniref:Copper transport protein n=1 Tax=Exophiala spinifera TaxID=91928 RepID=A0A0D2B497_9EURO|nr:uncharacterized protein PV08_08979 [Exophiala spinifera]KIW13788.1 hypothetical protein PV08_08979 [Exophiala spinifera]